MSRVVCVKSNENTRRSTFHFRLEPLPFFFEISILIDPLDDY